MHRAVAHDALFADILSARLKLRLDKAHSPAAVPEKLSHNGQYLAKRDERNIHRGEIHLLGDLLVGHIAEVGTLHIDHALVAPELPCELAVADVDGVDLGSSV